MEAAQGPEQVVQRGLGDVDGGGEGHGDQRSDDGDDVCGELMEVDGDVSGGDGEVC